MAIKFNTLKAEDIECRVSQINDRGLSLLLYKDARCDMNALDETVGAENWTRRHQVVNGNLFCTVSIKCGNEWVSKEDVGTESNTEAEKGQASDSFKRACVNWGIGRELYTAPFIWITADKYESSDRNGKKNCKDKFKVKSVTYNDRREISGLEIINCRTNEIVYRMGDRPTPAKPAAKSAEPKSDPVTIDIDPNAATECGRCHKPIVAYKDKSAKDLEIFSYVHYGKALCGKCIAILYAAEKAAEEKANANK